MQPANVIDWHRRLAALVDAALGLRRRDASPLALQSELTLHLGGHAKHRQHDAAGVARGGEFRFEDSKAGALLFELVHEVEHVARPEPIELHHHQLVARPDEFEDGGELVAAVAAVAADLPSADDLTAGGPKASGYGAAARVAPRIWPDC
jgi:hypothetical protein